MAIITSRSSAAASFNESKLSRFSDATAFAASVILTSGVADVNHRPFGSYIRRARLVPVTFSGTEQR